MSQRYQYEFVRLGEGLMSARKEAKQDYQDTVHQYAAKGRRLAQLMPNRAPKHLDGAFAGTEHRREVGS